MKKFFITITLLIALVGLVSCASVPEIDPYTKYEEAVTSAQLVVDWANSLIDKNNAFHNANIKRYERAKADLLSDEVYCNYMKKQNRVVDTSEWDNRIAAEKKWLRDKRYTVNFEIVESFKGNPNKVGECVGYIRGYDYTIREKRSSLIWAKPIMVHEMAHFLELVNGRTGHGKIFKEQAWNIGQLFFNMNEEELNYLRKDLARY